MFYCEDCRIKNEWPEAINRSHGPCELCHVVKLCWDRPSSTLPWPQKAIETLNSVFNVQPKHRAADPDNPPPNSPLGEPVELKVGQRVTIMQEFELLPRPEFYEAGQVWMNPWNRVDEDKKLPGRARGTWIYALAAAVDIPKLVGSIFSPADRERNERTTEPGWVAVKLKTSDPRESVRSLEGAFTTYPERAMNKRWIYLGHLKNRGFMVPDLEETKKIVDDQVAESLARAADPRG